MPKRKRLFTPIKHRSKSNTKIENEKDTGNVISKQPSTPKEVSTARGRLQGVLMEVLEPTLAEESGSSSEGEHTKNDSQDKNYTSDDENTSTYNTRVRQSYVLKLFDRSVDLSQFDEDTPLYPICRAWIANQPKAIYKDIAKVKEDSEPILNSIELPGPEGPPVSRKPELLPAQLAANKDNINLNYRDESPPSKEQLLQWHLSRWMAVRQAWAEQAKRAEARYEASQLCLNKITV